MKKSLIILAIIVLGIIGFLAIRSSNRSTDSDGQSTQSQSLGKAPNFSLQDFQGKIVSLTDFQGKPLVVNLWAAWCPFCVKELVDFATAQEEFKDQVVIIAIDRQEPLQTAKDFVDSLGITNDLIFLLDAGDSFYRSIGGFSMPETIFVDREGNIVDHKRGPMDLVEIRDRIKKIID